MYWSGMFPVVNSHLFLISMHGVTDDSDGSKMNKIIFSIASVNFVSRTNHK